MTWLHSRSILNSRCNFAFSRRDAPEVLQVTFAPKKQRAQGRPGARCTRGLACGLHKTKCTRAYRFSGNTPAFPAQWLYGLYRALPGERLFCHRRHAKNALRNLTPAPRRQDHTTSPYAPAPFVKGTFASTATRPTFVTIAKRPSCGPGMAPVIHLICEF